MKNYFHMRRPFQPKRIQLHNMENAPTQICICSMLWLSTYVWTLCANVYERKICFSSILMVKIILTFSIFSWKMYKFFIFSIFNRRIFRFQHLIHTLSIHTYVLKSMYSDLLILLWNTYVWVFQNKQQLEVVNNHLGLRRDRNSQGILFVVYIE